MHKLSKKVFEFFEIAQKSELVWLKTGTSYFYVFIVLFKTNAFQAELQHLKKFFLAFCLQPTAKRNTRFWAAC